MAVGEASPLWRRRGERRSAHVAPQATPAGVRRFAQRLREHGLLEYRSAINRLDAMPGSAMHAEAAAAGQIAPDLSGPQPLPFRHAAMEAIHGDVLAALAPLGPPSMHALCSLPGLLARRYLEGQAPEVLIRLMDIIRRQDHVVGEAFFAVLRAHETASGTKTVVDDLRRRNLDVAVATSQDLVRHGLAPSVEALREAIRIDAGL